MSYADTEAREGRNEEEKGGREEGRRKEEEMKGKKLRPYLVPFLRYSVSNGLILKSGLEVTQGN